MSKSDDKTVCRTPTPDKKPTRIDTWKYDVIRSAILKVVPQRGEGLLFSELPEKVRTQLSDDVLARLGSVSWYTTTVKLDLEVCGKICRVQGVTPQRLLRT